MAHPGWLVWMLHSANPGHDHTQTARLHEMLSLAAGLGIKVLTVSDTWRHQRSARRAADRREGIAQAPQQMEELIP